MELKHSELLKELNINDCPPSATESIELTAFRWVLDPIEHDLNFLPNYLFDQEKNNLEQYNDMENDRKCSRCSQSFFNSLNAAKTGFNKISETAKRNLGYTHVASGNITTTDGLATSINRHGHFGFFVTVACDFKSKFTIVEALQ